jgi:hypothetical protein
MISITRIAFAFVLTLTFVGFDVAALGDGGRPKRCREILPLEQSEDGQADWLHMQPQAYGLLDIVRAPDKASDRILKTLTRQRRIPTPEELKAQILSSIPKKYRGMFEDSNVLRDPKAEAEEADFFDEYLAEEEEAKAIALMEAFIEEYSQELYDFLMDPKPLVSEYNADGTVSEVGLFMNHDELVLKLQQSDPAAMRRFENAIANQSMLWFSQKLVPPTVRQLAQVMGFDQQSGVPFLFAITANEDMWIRASNSDNFMLSMQRAEARVIQAYARAIRGTDTPHAFRTRRITPTTRRMVEVLGLTRENTWYRSRLLSGLNRRFNLRDEGEREEVMMILERQLQHIIGAYDQEGNVYDINLDPNYNNPEWIFAMPRLFGRYGRLSDNETARLSAHRVVDGEDQEAGAAELDAIAGGYADARSPGQVALHDAARTMFRGTFNSYVDTNVFNQQNADRLVAKIEDSKGMVISSFTPGREINWAMVEGMKAKAKEEGKIVVLIPEAGLLEGTDPKLLNDPELNVLPMTIANDYLKLWLHPNTGRSKAFSGIKNIEHYRHGSTVIVPHHTMEHEVRPSGTNQLGPTALYSTGSINTGAVGGMGAPQSAKAEKITNQIKQGFLVVEKINNENTETGASNSWHVRPVEWRMATEFGTAGFTDRSIKYSFDIDENGNFSYESVRNPPRVFYLPDVHFISANPAVMRALVEHIQSQIEEGDEIAFVLPDPIDSKAINHHVEKTQGDYRALTRMLRNGTLDFNKEMNDAVANVNELLELFPTANVLFQYSNHSDEWIHRNLLNQISDVQRLVNGPVISELSAALDANPGMAALEYLLNEREEFNKSIDLRNTDDHYNRNNYVSDPSRVRVLRPGDPLPGNRDSEYNTFSHNHGHKGSNGAKGSPASHAEGMHRQITGDRHSPGYLARGTNFWAGVGATSLVQPYTRQGGYSSWGLAMAQIFDDGTMTLMYMDLNNMRFVQDPEGEFSTPEVFFGDEPLNPNGPVDNDDLRRERDTELFNEFVDQSAPRFEQGLIEP